MLRIATTSDIMLNVIIANDSENKTILLNYIKETFPQIKALLYTINPKWNDSIYDLEPQVYYGNDFIIEELFTKNNEEKFSFKINAKSFFQTNTKQAEILYQITNEFAALTNNEIVYDLYCGTGSIGIFCSKMQKK